MKRLLAIALTISVASCDTSTTADGTSSETQSSLQALADNVRKVPESPSASVAAGGTVVAGRRMEDGGCKEFLQFETYGPDALKWGWDAGYAWHVVRNKRVACTHAGTVLSGFEEFLRVDDSTTWRVVSEITVHAEGDRVFRSTFESEFGGGFLMRIREVEYQTVLGDVDLDHPRQTLEKVLSDGRIEVDLHARQILSDTIGWEKLYRDTANWRKFIDTIEYRYPIYDVTRGRAKIGDFYELRGHRTEVRDLEGCVIAPRVPAPRPQPDSMGLRILANTSDADSIRLSLRLQTVEPAGFAAAATALVLADTVMWGGAADSLPRDERVLALGTVGFAGGKRIDWRVPRTASYDRVYLLRRYPMESGAWGGWQIVGMSMLDGRVVAP